MKRHRLAPHACAGILLLVLTSAFVHAQGLNEADRLVFANGLFARGMYELASKEFEAFLKSTPDHPEADIAHFRLGECHRRRKNYITASQEFKYVVDHYPKSEYRLKAGFRRADLFMEIGQYDAAADLFDMVLKENPPDEVRAACLYFRSMALEKLDRKQEAVKLLEDLRTRFPSSEYGVYALLNLGQLYGTEADEADGAKQDPAKAAAFYKSVAAKPPTPRVGAEALFQLGNLHFRTKAFDKSTEAYRQLLAKYPDDQRADEARLQAAWAAHNAGLYAEALQMTGPLIARASSTNIPAQLDEWIYLKANAERQLARNEEAVQTYTQLLETYPTSSFAAAARYEKVLTLYRTKNYAQTVVEATNMELSDAIRKDVYWLLAESYAALQDTAQAIQYYRLVVKDFADSDIARDALYRLAYYLQGRKEYTEAARHYQLTAARYPDTDLAPAALFASGTCHALNNEHDQAVRDWAQLLQKYSSSPFAEEALFQKGMSEIRLERDEDAMASLEQLLRANAKSSFAADAWYWKGMLLRNQKNWQDAEKALRQALQSVPRNDLIREIEFALAGVLHKLDKTEEAATVYQRLVASPAKEKLTPAVLEWLAEYWHEKGNYTQAADAAKQIVEIEDAAWQQTGWGLLGRAQLASKEKKAAVESFRRAIACKANTRFAAESYLQLGEIALTEGSTDATEWLRHAATKAAGDTMLEIRARAYAGLGRAAKKAGNLEEAARYFMSVAVLFDDDALVPECLFEAAEALKGLGRGEEATQLRGELKERYPKSEWALRAGP